VSWLIEMGADVTLRMKDGSSIFDWAVSFRSGFVPQTQHVHEP